jgi:hypothetical protein
MILAPETIQQIAADSFSETRHCACIRGLSHGWEALPSVLATGTLLRLIGNVSNVQEENHTLDEYHPNGTHFWSEEAPICFAFYPYNICEVWGCTQCARAFLRFADTGAYHAEPRIRILQSTLIEHVTPNP